MMRLATAQSSPYTQWWCGHSAASPESCSPHEAHRLMSVIEAKLMPKAGCVRIALGGSGADAVKCAEGRGEWPRRLSRGEAEPMQLSLWIAFFVVSNLLGIEVFKAAVTLPWEEALLPGLLTVPLVALSALSATRILAA